jgi:hypothetical protein
MRHRPLELILFACISLACGTSAKAPELGTAQQELTAQVLQPTADLAVTNVAAVGASPSTALYTALDDGNTLTRADDGASYVAGTPGAQVAVHDVAFTSGPASTIAEVRLYTRGGAIDPAGPACTMQIELFDGANRIGNSPVRALGDWSNWEDVFGGLKLATSRNLHARVTFSGSDVSNCRYTQLFAQVSIGRAVTVTATTNFYWNSGVSPVAADFTQVPVGVFTSTASGWTEVPGAASGGTYTANDVPPGDVLARVGNTWVVQSGNSVDLGADRFGRPDAVWTGNAVSVLSNGSYAPGLRISAQNMAPFDGSQMQLVSANAGAVYFNLEQWGEVPVAPGAISLNGYNLPWFDLPLIDLSKGDSAVITQMVATPHTL